MDWIIPADRSSYRHDDAFKKFGYIDWAQYGNYSIGDTVYVYCTSPDSRIIYKTLVTKADMTSEEMTDDREFWENPNDFVKIRNGRFARLKFMGKTDGNFLKLNDLRENGLKGAPQGVRKLYGELLKYVEKNFI